VRTKTAASPQSVSSVDIYIGVRIRSLRLQLGMSQKALAEKLGIKFQQVQKYEAGSNRVSAARLFDICDFFGVSLASMFERKLKA
jgi:transcriptional regulator with XRE-family HTH domain